MSCNYWNTRAELEYLDMIGKSLPEGRVEPRRKMLKGYLEGLDKRTEFGVIDKAEIRKRVLSMLNRENQICAV